MIKQLAHVCLETADLQRCIAFYQDGLGFPVKFTFVRQGKPVGVYFSLGARSFLEVFERNPPAKTVHFSLETDNLDAFATELEAKGIECTRKQMGACGTWAIWVRDPDGNAFEVQEYTNHSHQFNGGECEVDW
ncbi:MAG: VOC family protein [Chthoniobacteraceae bacterium]